jgi:hypothetical protein
MNADKDDDDTSESAVSCDDNDDTEGAGPVHFSVTANNTGNN